MSVKYEVSAITGKYQAQDGSEKNRYTRMGVVLETKNGGLMIKLEAIPVGWDGFAYLNEPKPREGSAPPPRRAAAPAPRQAPRGGGSGFDDMGDDIPFAAMGAGRLCLAM